MQWINVLVGVQYASVLLLPQCNSRNDVAVFAHWSSLHAIYIDQLIICDSHLRGSTRRNFKISHIFAWWKIPQPSIGPVELRKRFARHEYQIIYAFTKRLLFNKYEPSAADVSFDSMRQFVVHVQQKRDNKWERSSCRMVLSILSSPLLHYARHHFDTWTRTNQERAICQPQTNKLVVRFALFGMAYAMLLWIYLCRYGR